MKLRQLRTLIAISEHPSFSAVGEAIGLSHSAVSLHVKALEDELGVTIADRSRRPPVLTERGHALVSLARRMVDLTDEMLALGADETLIGSLVVGVVPTAMIDLLPPALASLREAHPRLRIEIRTGLSGDLAQFVRAGEMDVAVSTAPELPLDGVRVREIVREPLHVIAPASAEEEDDRALLSAHPFIWFSRKTWAGQQIERRLIARGVVVRAGMEVDSLEAIESLVSNGLGASVVPRRAGGPRFPPSIKAVPFGDPQFERVLALIERAGNPKTRLADALLGELQAQAHSAG